MAIANTHAALIVQTSTIHHVDATSSLPQSIDGSNLSNGPPSGAVRPDGTTKQFTRRYRSLRTRWPSVGGSVARLSIGLGSEQRRNNRDDDGNRCYGSAE